jgi:hypothetical protein
MKCNKSIKIITRVFPLFFLPFIFLAANKSKTSSVVLKEEYINIRLDTKKIAYVNVKFIFDNTYNYMGDLAFPISEWIKMKNFKTIWNGKELKSAIIHAPSGHYYGIGDEKYQSLYKFTVPLTKTKKTEHTISYSYRIPFIDFNKDYSSKGYYVEYILKTGSFWKGRVTTLKIKINSDQTMVHCDQVLHLRDSYIGKCTGMNTWEFNAQDIELTKNINLLYRVK